MSYLWQIAFGWQFGRQRPHYEVVRDLPKHNKFALCVHNFKLNSGSDGPYGSD
jgi:hypothetical protein